jgi:hypothetical protein
VEWDDGVTLLDMIKQPFRESALVPSAREARLDPRFTAFIFVLTILYGAMGSYTSFKQTSLAEKTYRLSLLQACFPPPQNKLIADMCKTL